MSVFERKMTVRPRLVSTPGYRGPERRLAARRRRDERRRAIRWEPWKNDRRQLKGRRLADRFYFHGIY